VRKVTLLAFMLCSAAANASDLPDLNLTPGVTDPEVTESNLKETICRVTHFSWEEGHMPPPSFLEGVKKDQLKLYGYTDSAVKHYQMDHLIPLSLGGHPTDLKNIWPQVLITKWSARRKDYLEEILHEKVCKGEISLKEAQEQVRTNWIAAYEKYVGPVK